MNYRTRKIVFYAFTRSEVKRFIFAEAVFSPFIYTVLHKLYANDLMAILGSMASTSLFKKSSRLLQQKTSRGQPSFSIQEFLHADKIIRHPNGVRAGS
ncbi:hypothetical protein JOC77_002638 [Peribacillus deserti]|uniref:Uncharacterized protein n=1 Tax=Peribacillus deserti TaxID=673318 RepID=A0ABS2QJ57_9BACI|nr:hypothetical protein [Peribacillus deserti]MBM7693198.1 hypothetical protein [Peribacillus deserti]